LVDKKGLQKKGRKSEQKKKRNTRRKTGSETGQKNGGGIKSSNPSKFHPESDSEKVPFRGGG